jgi:hypothetical protein
MAGLAEHLENLARAPGLADAVAVDDDQIARTRCGLLLGGHLGLLSSKTIPCSPRLFHTPSGVALIAFRSSPHT